MIEAPGRGGYILIGERYKPQEPPQNHGIPRSKTLTPPKLETPSFQNMAPGAIDPRGWRQPLPILYYYPLSSVIWEV